ncbi:MULTISPECIES: contact-dependent growth inhibition system immunity protein [Xanthomonas]|uniref:contact-dependent growth inhibition system immunity protein n=1 Tax=Xanthomonas TaxID=338 RepID=UPI000E1EDF9C|nr:MULTISPECIES: contact-dependent growth inhibition system immunity protein [Xanthomonas]
MKVRNKMAEVSFNKDFFRIITMSQGMFFYADPDAPSLYLDPNVADIELGRALRSALEKSKSVSTEVFQEIFHSGEIERISQERDAFAMKNYAYKSKKSMQKKMNICTVTVAEEIEVQPMHQNSLGSYTVKKDKGPYVLRFPLGLTDTELGAAVREGFNHCTSSVR